MKVFISYKWEDGEHNRWVERLARDLRAKGIDALLDKWEVKLGESFSDYMTRGISGADALLFVMTPRSVAAAEAATSEGGAVEFEVQLATARRIAVEGFRFIGILRRGERPAAQLRGFRYADFRNDESYPANLDALVSDLLGTSERPPLGGEPAGRERLAEWTSVGQDLGESKLCGEFLSGGRDLIVWAESAEGPDSVIGFYREREGKYNWQTTDTLAFATRIHATAGGEVVVVQERHGVFVLDIQKATIVSSLPIEAVGHPIIRSEVVHGAFSIVVVGTDYGKIVAWDWQRDRILFERRYFPREDIVWINGLAFDPAGELLLFCVENTLIRARLTDGERVSEQELGPKEETTSVAVNDRYGLLAVGGIMETKVYDLGKMASPRYEVRNSQPMVDKLKFSQDGGLLGITYGMLGSGAAAVVDSESGIVLQRFADVWPPSTRDVASSLYLSIRSISFSDDGELLAIGEGGRVGLYRRGVIGI